MVLTDNSHQISKFFRSLCNDIFLQTPMMSLKTIPSKMRQNGLQLQYSSSSLVLVSICLRHGQPSGQKPLAAVRYTHLLVQHEQSYKEGMATFPVLTVQIAGVKYCQQYFIKDHGRYPIMSCILSYWRSAPEGDKQIHQHDGVHKSRIQHISKNIQCVHQMKYSNPYFHQADGVLGNFGISSKASLHWALTPSKMKQCVSIPGHSMSVLRLTKLMICPCFMQIIVMMIHMQRGKKGWIYFSAFLSCLLSHGPSGWEPVV